MPDATTAAASAAAPAGPGRAFVYGTLMADEVLRLLLRRVPPSRAAAVQGLRRCRVRGQVFPAVVTTAAPGASVRGRVLLGLSPREVEILDVYEAEEYRRERVKATIVAEGEEGEGEAAVGVAAAAGGAGGAGEEAGLPSVGDVVEADIYVWRDEYRAALDEGSEWSYDEWRRSHLAADQLEADGPDWDYAAFLARDLEQYLRDSAEFMAEAFGGGA